MSHRSHLSVAVGFIALVLAPFAFAQTGPQMFIKPWEDQTINLSAAGNLYNNSYVRGSDENLQMKSVESEGRWRILGNKRESPVAGFEFHYFDNDTTSAAIPNHLVDTAVSLGSPVAMIQEHWFVIAIAGIGYAGDSWFADSDAYYGMGSIIVGREFTKNKALIVGLDYNGNRPYFPDIPVPGFAYRDVINDRLKYTVGAPYSFIEWTPVDEVEIVFRYALLSTIEASIDYHVTKHASLFLRLTDNARGFHIDGQPDTRRIFFESKATELGVKYHINENIAMTFLGGYAFGQTYSTGFSLRDSDIIAKPANEFYVRGMIEWGF